MEIIERKEYFDKLKALKGKHIIKIITGVRRCGKSTLMRMFADYLRSQGVGDSQIISLNFEDFDNYELRNAMALHQYVKERTVAGKTMYLFFDEIQHVERFSDVLDSFFIKPEYDIYVTGSNAYLLSSEIATFISGRYVEIKMLPLSFGEFAKAYASAQPLQQVYNAYVSWGSFPYVTQLDGNDEIIDDYLNGIYNAIVLKDVMTRYKISDPLMLESVIRFALDNIGNILSTKRIADTMTSAGRKIDVKTVEKYLGALTESYILYKVGRYNIKGRQYLRSMEKYYVVDLGLRRMLLGSRPYDVGHILENVVFLELQRRGYDVYVGKMDDLEVDFVTIKSGKMEYYQVSATVAEEKTLKRELAPLLRISDNYPKYLLTLDSASPSTFEGIHCLNALEWLMER